MFLKQPRIFEDYLYYGNYNFSYYSFFLRGYKGLKVVTICYYKYSVSYTHLTLPTNSRV